jgi:exopolyphosphatase/guanosine-5'-triphosphate,3'-diphosphate pyrophosphatase
VHLAHLAGGRGSFDPAAVEGARVDAAAARAWAGRLARLDLAARVVLGVEPERADVLPAGLAVLAAVLDRLGAAQVRVSGRGLRHGIALDLLGA